MIVKSHKLSQMIIGMVPSEREAVARIAKFHLSKDNIDQVGHQTSRILGMSGPIFQMLQALSNAGGMCGDWTMCEAPVSKNGKMAVFLFQGSEQEICAATERICAATERKKPKLTPPSVVVKMIISRIKKIDEVIEFMDDKTWNVPKSKLTFTDIDDIKHGRLDKFKFNRRIDYIQLVDCCNHEIRSLVKILNRENVTPDIIKQAWDLYCVTDVMES